MKLILEILLFSVRTMDIQFEEIKEFTRRNHTGDMVLRTIKRVELLNKKKFVTAALDKKTRTFVVYMTVLPTTSIYPSIKAQIQVFIAKKASIEILAKYSDYDNVFLPDLGIDLFKHTRINDHAIYFLEEK